MMKRAVQRTYGARQFERAREKLGQEKKERIALRRRVSESTPFTAAVWFPKENINNKK